MIGNTEFSEVELVDRVAEIRRQLAVQIRNSYNSHSALADRLEEKASESSTLVLRVLGADSVDVLEGSQRDDFIREICGQVEIDRVVKSSQRFDGREWPAGMHALHKKLNHASVRQAKGEELKSNFDFEGFRKLKFGNTNIGTVQQVAEGVIIEIMQNPSTIIERERTIDIINEKGQGVRVCKPMTGREGRPLPPFSGFIDSSFLAKPVTGADRVKMVPQGGSIAA